MEKDQTKENLSPESELLSKKFVFLLENSGMPDEVKEAWLALLPEMSLEQLDRFFDILEAQYLNEKTKDIDEKYKKELEKVVEEFKKDTETNNKDLLQKIDSFKKIYASL